MNEEKHWETAALGETMVARIEIEEIGIAANEKEMTDAVTALPGVREVKIENGAMHVTYDPLATTEKKIEEAVRASGNTVKAATADTGSRTVRAMIPAMLKPSNTGKRLRLTRCTGLALNKVFHLPLTQRKPPTKTRARGTSPSKMSPAAENIVTRESEGFLPGKGSSPRYHE